MAKTKKSPVPKGVSNCVNPFAPVSTSRLAPKQAILKGELLGWDIRRIKGDGIIGGLRGGGDVE